MITVQFTYAGSLFPSMCLTRTLSYRHYHLSVEAAKMFLVVAAKQKQMFPYTSSSVCYMLDENTLKSVQRLQNI